MAMTFARAVICGRATKDVETRTVTGKNGDFLASTLNLAVDRAWNLPKAENGENATDFYRIELTGPQATYSQYVKKGDVVTVIALPYTGKPYTDKNNVTHQDTVYKGEEIFIFGKPIPNQNNNNAGDANGGYQNQGYQQNGQGYQNQPRPNYQQPQQNQGYQQVPPNYQQPQQNQGYQQAPPNYQQPQQNQGYQQAPPNYQQPQQNQGYQQAPPQNGFDGMNPPEGFAPVSVNDPFGLGG